jgi:hypothetical protein
LYIERKERWEKIFDFGSRQAARMSLKEQDITEEIQKFRQAGFGIFDFSNLQNGLFHWLGIRYIDKADGFR